tara:strand:- start:1295 stop:1594 length:300 start_codon:yes stop_codon:yes gene_type:complete
MVKLDEMDELEKELEEVINKIDSDTKKQIKEGEETKDDIVNDAGNASAAVTEGFGNINEMIYERLDINRVCLMILFVLVLILIFKEDIMKTPFIKNLLK